MNDESRIPNDEFARERSLRHSSFGFDSDFGFRHSGFASLVIAFLFVIAGCCTTHEREPYYGPTSRMADVVSVVNQNNELIPSVWANTDFSVEVNDHGNTHHVSGSGVLIYRRPGDLLLRGSKDFVGPIFEIGSNAENYWMSLIPQVETAWFGSYKNLGKPCVRPLPIQPDMLVEVLGVSTFNTNFLQQPIPVMRFNHDEDAYEFTWSARLGDHWAAKKMVMYDRATHDPKRVLIFDEDGRTILRADLKDAIAVEAADVPQDRWPRVSTKYDLFFPESKTRLSLSLSDVALTKGRVPNNATFRMPVAEQWGVKKENVIEVDKDCGE